MKKRTLILIICAALAVSLGVGGIIYAEVNNQKNNREKKDNTVLSKANDIEKAVNNTKEQPDSCLTDDWTKDYDKYSEVILNVYRNEWNKKSETVKEQILKETKAGNPELSNEEAEIKAMKAFGVGSTGMAFFTRFYKIESGEISDNIARVSYEKVKSLGTKILAESEEKTEEEKLLLRMSVAGLMATVPDIEIGSGNIIGIYSLDDSLTKFIIYNYSFSTGPVYVELNETRDSVVKEENIWGIETEDEKSMTEQEASVSFSSFGALLTDIFTA